MLQTGSLVLTHDTAHKLRMSSPTRIIRFNCPENVVTMEQCKQTNRLEVGPEAGEFYDRRQMPVNVDQCRSMLALSTGSLVNN